MARKLLAVGGGLPLAVTALLLAACGSSGHPAPAGHGSAAGATLGSYSGGARAGGEASDPAADPTPSTSTAALPAPTPSSLTLSPVQLGADAGTLSCGPPRALCPPG